MTKEEIENFLLTGTRTGNVATFRKDGAAHVVPVWFSTDKDESGLNIVFCNRETISKG